MSTDPFLIDSLRSLHGLSLRKLAKDAGIDASSLSYWLRGIESRVSEERLKPAKALLGLGEDGLLPGVHRWLAPSPLNEDIKMVEKSVLRLLPGGGSVIQVRRAGILNPINTESSVTYNAFVGWVLVPEFFPDIRIILKIGTSSRIQQLLNFSSLRSFRPVNLGENWRWLPDDDIHTDNPSKWITLSPDRYREMMEKNILIERLDSILGLQKSEWEGISLAAGTETDRWTWDLVFRRAKEAGLKPEEVAKKLRLSK